MSNFAVSGGAMFLYGSAVLFIGTKSFCENVAGTKNNESYNELTNRCNAISYSFRLNNVLISGGAILSQKCAITYTCIEHSSFRLNNTSKTCVKLSSLTYYNISNSLHFLNHVLFFNANYVHYYGGAMVLDNTKLSMNGSICCANNYAGLGGGALFILNSLILYPLLLVGCLVIFQVEFIYHS